MRPALIPFNRASIDASDLDRVADAVNAGHIAGGGPATRAAEAVLADIHGGARTLLTTSCTHALELSALLTGAGSGTEVIVPAYTFVSSAAAFMLHGMTPIFVDVRDDTLNLDLDAVEDALTPRTRAICAVHYAGVGAEPDRLAEFAARHGLMLIEDNAHGLGGRWNGRRLGTFGSLSTLSFHETKNVTCGEGGALVINDPTLVERAEILREKGTDRARFFRGQVDKYTWVDVGSSWVLSDLLAAILVGQLDRLATIQASRHAIWDRYARELADWAASRDVMLPDIPAAADHTAHLFHLRLADLRMRTRFIEHLRSAGIMAVFHYQPLHSSQVGRRHGWRDGRFPVSEAAADRLVRLPLFVGLTAAQQGRVIEAVLSF